MTPPTPAPPDERDRATLRFQMGREPRGLRAVEARCRWGHPTVVSVAPVLRGPRGPEPFPTTFWLTCPALREDIARAEAAGGVRLVEAAVERDPGLALAVAADHARCAEERSAAMDAADRRAARAGGFLDVLEGSGIGGSRDRAHVKCLHAHYAFHRAHGGAVGALVDARWAPAECAADDVRCDRAPGASPPPRTADSSPPPPEASRPPAPAGP